MQKLHDRQIKEILIRDNVDFKELALKHQECEQKLQEISARTKNIRTDKEWMEEHNLKKQKLRLKDSMQKYILEYKRIVEVRDFQKNEKI